MKKKRKKKNPKKITTYYAYFILLRANYHTFRQSTQNITKPRKAFYVLGALFATLTKELYTPTKHSKQQELHLVQKATIHNSKGLTDTVLQSTRHYRLKADSKNAYYVPQTHPL